MFVQFFSPTFHGPISKLITYLESLGHGGPNKIVCSQIDAEIKKFCLIFFFQTDVCPKHFYSIQIYIEENVCPKHFCSIQIQIEENVCPKHFYSIQIHIEENVCPKQSGRRAWSAVGAQNMSYRNDRCTEFSKTNKQTKLDHIDDPKDCD